MTNGSIQFILKKEKERPIRPLLPQSHFSAVDCFYRDFFAEPGTAKCVYTIGADLISQERDGKVSVYLYDGHGSIVGLANESGIVTDTYSYDAFGNLLKSTGSTKNCYRYCGEQFDETTGLYYLRARYMDTSTGRFISQDTYQGDINDPVSLHKYLYANANPVTYSDPSGNNAIVWIEENKYNAAIVMLFSTLIVELSYYSMTGNSFVIEISEIICEWLDDLASGSSSSDLSQNLIVEVADIDEALVSDFLEAKKKSPNLPSGKKVKLDMDHIMSGHSAGGNRGGPKKDRFPQWMTAPMIERAIRIAYSCWIDLQYKCNTRKNNNDT